MDIQNSVPAPTVSQKKPYVAPAVTNLGDAVAKTLGSTQGPVAEVYGFISWT
jgi:hypothetical protein